MSIVYISWLKYIYYFLVLYCESVYAEMGLYDRLIHVKPIRTRLTLRISEFHVPDEYFAIFAMQTLPIDEL